MSNHTCERKPKNPNICVVRVSRCSHTTMLVEVEVDVAPDATWNSVNNKRK